MRHIQGPFRFYGINRALEKYLRGVYRRFAGGVGGGLFLAACGARFTRIGRRRTSSSRYAALATFSAATVQGLYRSAMMITPFRSPLTAMRGTLPLPGESSAFAKRRMPAR